MVPAARKGQRGEDRSKAYERVFHRPSGARRTVAALIVPEPDTRLVEITLISEHVRSLGFGFSLHRSCYGSVGRSALR
jgi:hypothetical protein